MSYAMQLPSLFAAISLCASLAACSSLAPQPTRGTDQSSSAVGPGTDSPYAAAFPSLFVRGTVNSWQSTPMTLVADHEWSVQIESGAAADERFKFDVFGDWSVNFGDNEGDQIADTDGRDIPIAKGAPLTVHFNDESSFYWIEERTWSAELSLQLPAGIDRWALRMQRVELSIDGEPYGWNYIYADDEHASAYVPLSGLRRGSKASLTFDAIVSQRRLVGDVSFVIDGTVDPIAVQMPLKDASLESYGVVELKVLADRWENGAIAGSPFAGVGVFLGDWHAGNLLANTGDDGKVSLMLPSGAQTLNTMIMTSSHSMASGGLDMDVVAGKFSSAELHMAPLSVVVRAYFDAGWGKALYLTGASSYLGEWKTATRMTLDPQQGAWSYQGNLPVGLPFKIVLAPWSDEATISTNGVSWESGPDHTVTPPQGSYYSDIVVQPSF
jgi:hypothetical protein